MSRILTHFHATFLASSALSLVACSNSTPTHESSSVTGQKVIFGPDDFRDVGPLSEDDPWFRRAQATASLFKSGAVSCDEDTGNCELATKVFDAVTFALGGNQNVTVKHLPLCEHEQFSGQPQGSYCTGFLIADDLAVTAGHCVDDPTDCEAMKLVFGFMAADTAGLDISTTVPMNDVYSCSEVIASVSQGSNMGDLDFAIVRLDREVTGRAPLDMRTSGAIADGTNVNTIGGYHGLSLKISDNATVLNNPLSEPRFEVNLDAGKGSSGSAVFEADSGVVEGILVSGPVSKNYEVADAADGSECARAIRCDNEEGCNTPDVGAGERDWVRVTRIASVVEVLEGRSCFDGLVSPGETDVDCGGPRCAPCLPDQHCERDDDCGLPGSPDRRPSCWEAACGDDGLCINDVSTCDCQSDVDCDDGVACTIGHCSSSNTCWYEETDECVACTVDETCGGPELASCVVPQCSDRDVCNNDFSACECTANSDCDDGVACTRDVCFVSTMSCIHIPEDCDSGCTEESALDLGAPGESVTVPNDACLRVRDAYPSWWGEDRAMQLQSAASGDYPVPYSWTNSCSGASGSGLFSQDWQSDTLNGVNASCATLIDLGGDGSGSVSLHYFGG